MADDVQSQGRFIGWLAIALLVFAVLAAGTVLIAANMTPSA